MHRLRVTLLGTGPAARQVADGCLMSLSAQYSSMPGWAQAEQCCNFGIVWDMCLPPQANELLRRVDAAELTAGNAQREHNDIVYRAEVSSIHSIIYSSVIILLYIVYSIIIILYIILLYVFIDNLVTTNLDQSAGTSALISCTHS